MTIEQSSSQDNAMAEEDENDESITEWVPRPFDPHERVVAPASAPLQQLPIATSTIAEPSAPLDPNCPAQISYEETSIPTAVNTEADDAEEPPPLYESIANDCSASA
ncbi:hypothetical protein BGW41_003205 [Actinomortierella wolfii]|nr:hypothetical protein BGW41_003205 [Actinomortierella wolfii]